MRVWDNDFDRRLGVMWEERFAGWVRAYGHRAEPITQRNGAPDVLVEGEHAHEVKHKRPTLPKYIEGGEPIPLRRVGLESYRIELFERYERDTGIEVYYSIHDHGGDRLSDEDEIWAWRTARLRDLLEDGVASSSMTSYHRGEPVEVGGVFFRWGAFRSLDSYLRELG